VTEEIFMNKDTPDILTSATERYWRIKSNESNYYYALACILYSASASTAMPGVDLSGEYWFCSLSADVNTNVPCGKRGTVVVDGNEWTQEWDDYGGRHTFTLAYTTSCEANGSIHVKLSSGTYNIGCNGDVMLHANITPDANNWISIDIIARKATNLKIDDVVGSYAYFEHRLGWDARSDGTAWGTITLNTDGTGTQFTVDEKGNRESSSFSWTFDDVNEVMQIPGKSPVLFCKNGLALIPEPLPVMVCRGRYLYQAVKLMPQMPMIQAPILLIFYVFI
jgi:hypothetical protein